MDDKSYLNLEGLTYVPELSKQQYRYSFTMADIIWAIGVADELRGQGSDLDFVDVLIWAYERGGTQLSPFEGRISRDPPEEEEPTTDDIAQA